MSLPKPNENENMEETTSVVVVALQPLKIAFVFFPGGAAAAVVARPQVLITSFQF